MPIEAVHIDLDGVIWLNEDVIPGVPEAVAALQQRFKVLFLTNTSRLSTQQIVAKLGRMGIAAKPEEVLTAARVGALYMASKKPRGRVFLIAEGEVDKEMQAVGLAVTRKEERCDFVFVGYDEQADYKMLNTAMRLVLEGAELVGGSSIRIFPTPEGQSIATGPLVKAIEYATSTTATLMGKPEPSFFKLGLALTKTEPAETVMVGDDLEVDIAPPQKLGIKTVLVETGTHKAADCEKLGIKPDWVVLSLADVPKLLAGLGQ